MYNIHNIYTLINGSYYIVSDREMLRVWEDLSVMYRKDHTTDRSHEYIEVSVMLTVFHQ